MPSNVLLLLLLVGGYWCIHIFSYTRIRSQMLDGYRLLLESVSVGAVLGFAAYVVIVILDWRFPGTRNAWHAYAPHLPYAATAIGAAIVGVAGPMSLNAVFHVFGITKEKNRRRAVQRYGNSLQRTLQDALDDERLVCVTLENKKAYVGIVAWLPTLSPTDTYFSLIPIFSGYRDKDTLNLIFTVAYLDIYEKGFSPSNFKVVLPMANIRSLAFFDPKAYPEFIVEQKESGSSANFNVPPDDG